MTDMEWAVCVKAVNEAKLETAEKIKRLIYKYGEADTLSYYGDCMIISRETLAVIFDILAPEMETEDENIQQYKPEDDEDDEDDEDVDEDEAKVSNESDTPEDPDFYPF